MQLSPFDDPLVTLLIKEGSDDEAELLSAEHEAARDADQRISFFTSDEDAFNITH